MNLNSKSEFNRCRVPRLRIDMEGWRGKEREKQEQLRKVPEEGVDIIRLEEVITGLEDDVQTELELCEVENQSRRMENKRKRVDEPSKPEERKRKFAKLVNWGELESIQEVVEHTPGGGGMSMEDWVITKGMEEEQSTRDWLVMETLQPEKRLKQMKLDIPVRVKKTGNDLNINTEKDQES